jgi:hypothetical protein
MDRGDVTVVRVLLLVAALALPTAASAASLPLEDGFELVAAGDYPEATGWEILSLGKSAWVSGPTTFSDSKSFRLDCWPWAASVHYLQLDEVPDEISYQASVYVDPNDGLAGYVGFMTGDDTNQYAWNAFRVDGAGPVEFHGQDVVYVGQYSTETWCTVRADLDYQSLTADLWLDGNLVLEDVPIVPKLFTDPVLGEVALDRFGLGSPNIYPGELFVFSNVVYFDDLVLQNGESTLAVTIDIKPGSYPNPINPRSQGSLPVAILSDGEFDATQIDVTTLSLLGAGVATRGRQERYLAHEDDVNGDGLLDLVCQFESRYLDLGQLVDGWATLTGVTDGGQEFEGWDEVTVVPRP